MIETVAVVAWVTMSTLVIVAAAAAAAVVVVDVVEQYQGHCRCRRWN